MRKIHYLLFIALMAIAMSCSQENLLIPDTETTAQETPASTKITLPEALKNAESAFGMLDLNTRAIRIPESVEYIGANYQTRSSSSNEDVKYYIVNYADNQGFAVLSADAEKGKVFALSDEGSISLSDTIDNPGLGVFFNKLNKWIDIPLDTTLTVTPKDTIPALPYPFISKVSPRMPKNVQKWDARKIFGTEIGDTILPCYNGICGSAQIFATFKHPEIWKVYGVPTYFINWEAINNYVYPKGFSVYSPSTDDPGILNLFNIITQAGGSWSLGDGPDSEMFKEQGYETRDNYCPDCRVYNGIEISVGPSDLADGFILLSRAQSNGRVLFLVVDGYLQYDYKVYNPAAKYGSDILFHCVWGTGGKGNGYFALAIDGNNSSISPSIFLDEDNVHKEYDPNAWLVTYHAFRPSQY